MMHVVVIGGGISGLSAAEHITRMAPDTDLTLLEASPRLGGHVHTERVDGFIMEAGPDVMLAAKPPGVDLARRVGLGERLVSTNPTTRGSYILSHGTLRRVPEGLSGLVPSRIMPFVTTSLISPAGKLRVAAEVLVPPRRDERDESIEDFVVRRLGREMYDQLVEPMLSGVSAGDGRRLSIHAMFPQLRDYEREHGGLVRGMFAVNRNARATHSKRGQQGNGPAPTVSGFVSFAQGLGELVDGVARAIRSGDSNGRRVHIRTGSAVRSAQRDNGGRFVLDLDGGEALHADAVVVATPSFAAAAILRSVDEALAAQLQEIEYASTVTLSLVYPMSAVPRPLDATGYIVPRLSGRPVLACTWTSSKFTGRAPIGMALFRLFLGGATRGSFVDRTDAELIAMGREEMREVMGITTRPTLVHINRFACALPQYTVGHLSRIAQIEDRTATVPGLALAGAAYRGIGIPDCVRSGQLAAEAVLRQVRIFRSSVFSGPAHE